MRDGGDSDRQSILSPSAALRRSKLTGDDPMHAHAENMELTSTEEGSQYISGLLEGPDARGRQR
jgi:hypothetical protein